METYRSGLLVFHVFCDSCSIPEEQWAPCSADLLSTWIANMAGTFARTSVKNYIAGVWAWHVIHGVEWNINKAELDTITRGAERLQPDQSKRKKRQPYTVDYISQILTDLDPNNPLDVACAACLTTGFYCTARLGELTVPTLKDFAAESHVTPAQIRKGQDRNGFECTIIHIPKTKTSQINGAILYRLSGTSHRKWASRSPPEPVPWMGPRGFPVLGLFFLAPRWHPNGSHRGNSCSDP